jgi:hypothetical protein
MSRTDGTYPSYVKVNLDAAHPKDGWNDGCRRCSNCGKSWPNVAVFSPSPCHNVVAGIVKSGTPDMPWAKAVSELRHAKFERYYEKWNDGASDEELYWTKENDPSDYEMSEGMREIEKIIGNMEDSNAR